MVYSVYSIVQGWATGGLHTAHTVFKYGPPDHVGCIGTDPTEMVEHPWKNKRYSPFILTK